MKHLTFNGFNNCEIAYTLWDEVEAPKAIVQISHGMAEYVDRYDDFAHFLNSKGYIVAGDDHRGHGKTVGEARLGITNGDAYSDTIEDIHILGDMLRNQYKLPLFLLGHSYGSFLSQGYVQKYSDEIKGLILSGSAYMGGALIGFASLIARTQLVFFNEEKPAKLINTLSFGGYDKPFKSENQIFAWLSRDKDQVLKYCADKFCGYVMCIGFQNAFFNGLKRVSKPCAINSIRKDLPVLITSGDSDPVGGNGKLVNKLYEMYQSAGLTNVDLKLWKDGRHEILNELNKEEVYNKMLEFFESNLA